MTGIATGSGTTEVGRRRRRSPNDNSIPIWLGPAMALFAMIFVGLGFVLVREELRLSADGVTAQATVVSVERREGTGDDADTYWLGYRFTTADGVAVAGSSQIDVGRARTTARGDLVIVTYLPSDPSTSRLGTPDFQPFPSVVVLLFGALFVAAGIAVTLSARGERRAAAAARAAGLPAGTVAMPAADAAGTVRFGRSPIRIVADLVLAPLGAVIFLAMAAWLLSQAGRDPTTWIGVLGFGFFGLLMASGAIVTVRRGARATLLEIGRDGIWLSELGRQPWIAIREIRIEAAPLGGSRRTSSAYRRLGVVPRDPGLAAHAPGGMARGLSRAFYSFVALVRPGTRVPDIGAMAPFGVAEYELGVPLESVVPLLAPHARVIDSDGRVLADPSAGAGPGEAPKPVSGGGPALLGGLLAGSGAPFMPGPTSLSGAAAPTTAAAAPTTAAAASPGPAGLGLAAAQPRDFQPAAGLVAGTPSARQASASATFRRRGSAGVGAISDLLRALMFVGLPVVVVVVFVAVGTSGGGPGSVIFVVFPLLIGLVFLAAGIPALLEAIERVQVGTGDEEALVVDDDGISMTGMGRLRWGEIAAARVGNADVVEGSEGASPSRPRLEIVPRDLRRLAARSKAARARDRFMAWRRRLTPWGDRAPRQGAFGLDLDLLEADADDVIDLVARHRVVEE